MSFISLLLSAVNDSVNVFNMKVPYSEPKIYTGGVDISGQSKLSKTQKSDTLSKDWYIYYSYRDPKTDKLRRQPIIESEPVGILVS